MKKKNDTEVCYDFTLSFIIICILIILKLTNIITLPWVWVLAPLWVPLATFSVIFIFGILITVIVAVIECIRDDG
jgi:hypothetical protein